MKHPSDNPFFTAVRWPLVGAPISLTFRSCEKLSTTAFKVKTSESVRNLKIQVFISRVAESKTQISLIQQKFKENCLVMSRRVNPSPTDENSKNAINQNRVKVERSVGSKGYMRLESQEAKSPVLFTDKRSSVKTLTQSNFFRQKLSPIPLRKTLMRTTRISYPFVKTVSSRCNASEGKPHSVHRDFCDYYKHSPRVCWVLGHALTVVSDFVNIKRCALTYQTYEELTVDVELTPADFAKLFIVNKLVHDFITKTRTKVKGKENPPQLKDGQTIKRYKILPRFEETAPGTSIDELLKCPGSPKTLAPQRDKSRWMVMVECLLLKADMKKTNYVGYYDAVLAKPTDCNKYLVYNSLLPCHLDYFIDKVERDLGNAAFQLS